MKLYFYHSYLDSPIGQNEIQSETQTQCRLFYKQYLWDKIKWNLQSSIVDLLITNISLKANNIYIYVYMDMPIYMHIYKHKYIYMHMHIHTHICWFNFDALAQGNAYKPTKEPINYRGPGGDRTHDLQTEATPPAASCPARTLHATEIAPKKRNSNDLHVAALDNWQPIWNAQVSISTPVRVNFELRPGAGDIHICWVNFDALAQGNAYKPTKEPIKYRGTDKLSCHEHFTCHRHQMKPLVSDTGMHYGTCVMHVGITNLRWRETFSAFPAHTQPAFFSYLARGPWSWWTLLSLKLH